MKTIPSSLAIEIKCGQSFESFPQVGLLDVSTYISLEQLKFVIFRHLGVHAPCSQNDLVLAYREERGALVELKEAYMTTLERYRTYYVFSKNTWIIQGPITESTIEERCQAMSKVPFRNNVMMQQLRKMQQEYTIKATESFSDFAARFGLQGNPTTDQFDAAADQLKKHPQFAGETKETVRARAIQWIRDNDHYDLGNGTTLRKWIVPDEAPESSFDDYLSKAEQPKWWGDEVTLLAICESYQVPIVLLRSMYFRGSWYHRESWYHVFRPTHGAITAHHLWIGHLNASCYGSLVEASAEVIQNGISHFDPTAHYSRMRKADLTYMMTMGRKNSNAYQEYRKIPPEMLPTHDEDQSVAKKQQKTE